MSNKIVQIRAALEVALKALPGIVPAATITASAVGGTFTTATAHGLATGVSVALLGHTGSVPAITGNYLIVVLTATTFSLKTSQGVAISLTTGGTGGTVQGNLTSVENMDFLPIPDIPYQELNHFNQNPDNPTYGAAFHRESGFLQVSLYYPLKRGSNAAMTRAGAIQDAFYRGRSFSLGDSDTLYIESTPWVGKGGVDPDGDRYMIPVKIFYYANVFS